MDFRNLTNKKWALSVALLLTLCALLFGCDGVGSQTDVTTPPTETTAPLAGMHQLHILEEGPLYMEVGDTLALTTDAPEALRDGLTWISSAPCVGVTQRGVLTAQVLGKATVTVEYHGFEDSIAVEVVDELPTQPDRPAESQPAESGSASSESAPIDGDPADTDPSDTDPSDTDPSDTDPSDTDPSDTDPIVTEPDETPTEPETEPDSRPIPPTVIIEAENSPEGYRPAGSYEEALNRTQNGELSGYPYVPDQAPNVSDYRPMQDGKYIKNNDPYYIDENTYVVVDAYGREVFRIYRGGAYITLEEVAAYVWAFGDIPANHATSKSAKPTTSIWGEYLRVNHSRFSGDTSKYPYEPVLPRISGLGGDFTYYEMDVGTTGTDCDPAYRAELYNNGSRITRGAARIVYARYDRNGNKIIEHDEKYVFYTYNHYNDFQEYLNYYGGWGEMFGNITGGGTISSKYDYNPTDYVPVVNGALTARSARLLPVLWAEPAAERIRAEATAPHYDFRRYLTLAA